MKRRALFILLVLLQCAFLLGIIAYRQWWLQTGRRVVLTTAPVDPRDPLRGDYVALTYAVSTLDQGELGLKEAVPANSILYVGLTPAGDGSWQATSLSRRRPASGPFPFLRGRSRHGTVTVSRWRLQLTDDQGASHPLEARWVSFKQGDRVAVCVDRRGEVRSSVPAEKAGSCGTRDWQQLLGTVSELKEERRQQVALEYGIERYYVEEGAGRPIEAARNRDLRVEVALQPDGRAQVVRLFLDGQPVQ